MGRRPEHSFYPGSGYCGRRCHHPHVHIIVPGGGISPDGQRWIACRPGFFLPVRVLSRLFRRLFLEQLSAAYHAGQLQFFGDLTALADATAFSDHLAPLRRTEWVVYAKRPFGGPEAVLAYLSRYTHRVAIANSRIVAFNDAGVTFKWKDYRDKQQPYGKVMTLAIDEFIRRFLIHVLPSGFHRIRHYGLFANGGRAENITRARRLLDVPRAAAATCRHRRCGWWGARAVVRLSLPVLRRAHDRHRDVRARLHTATSSNAAHPDRQLMTAARYASPSRLAGIGGSIVHPPPPRSTHHHDIATRRAGAAANSRPNRAVMSALPSTPPPIPAMPGPMQPTSRLSR